MVGEAQCSQIYIENICKTLENIFCMFTSFLFAVFILLLWYTIFSGGVVFGDGVGHLIGLSVAGVLGVSCGRRLPLGCRD